MSHAIQLVRDVVLAIVVFSVVSTRAQADALNLTLDPQQTGPFLPGMGGFIDFSVVLEMIDSEGDGIDTQGNAGVAFNILTDTGVPFPEPSPAPTGESGVFGPADVTHDRYQPSSSPEPQFVGGYGFNGSSFPFGGFSDADDRSSIGNLFGLSWVADAEPNAPGLQPLALAGVGYGERPAGGNWLFAVGQIPIPFDPGVYTIELVPYAGAYLLPGIDLTVDHESGFRGAFEPQELISDSFSFTVVPEPGSLFLLLVGALAARRVRTP